MFGVALSLAEFALVASMLGYVRRVEPGALPSSTARREPAYCRYSGCNRAHRGREYGNRSGAARLSRLGNSSHRGLWCWRRHCCDPSIRLARSRTQKFSRLIRPRQHAPAGRRGRTHRRRPLAAAYRGHRRRRGRAHQSKILSLWRCAPWPCACRALPRPERLGLTMKYTWAFCGFAPGRRRCHEPSGRRTQL
jgi:hypothetical protein